MSQNTFQAKRENLHKQKRKKDLETLFNQKRQKLSANLVQKQNQTFRHILPLIVAQNYQENRFLLSHFSKSFQHNYELLPIVSFAFQYVLVFPQDKSSWEILTYLSYYEDFQIPQTEDFALTLLKFIQFNSQLASQLLLNLSKSPKSSFLCFRLIDFHVLDLIEDIIQTQETFYHKQTIQNNFFGSINKENLQFQIFNFLLSLSYLFNLKPLMQQNLLKKICRILNQQIKSNKYLCQVHDEAKFKLISNLIQDFTCVNEVIQLILYQFKQTLENKFFKYQSQCLRFINFCLKNNTLLTQKLIHNVLSNIKSHTKQNKIQSYQILQKIILTSQKNQQMQVQANKFSLFNQNLIVTTKLPSFEEFNLMFQTQNHKKNQQSNKLKQKNKIILLNLILKQSFEQQLKIIYETFYGSQMNLQNQIISYLQKFLETLIQQLDKQRHQESGLFKMGEVSLEQIVERLNQCIMEQQFFIFVHESMSSYNEEIKRKSLEILRKILLYIHDFSQFQDIQQSSKITIQNFIIQLQKRNIISLLQNEEMRENNIETKELIQQILNLLRFHGQFEEEKYEQF